MINENTNKTMSKMQQLQYRKTTLRHMQWCRGANNENTKPTTTQEGGEMKKQEGYINLDITPILFGLVIFGIAIGLFLAFVIPWLWGDS